MLAGFASPTRWVSFTWSTNPGSSLISCAIDGPALLSSFEVHAEIRSGTVGLQSGIGVQIDYVFNISFSLC